MLGFPRARRGIPSPELLQVNAFITHEVLEHSIDSKDWSAMSDFVMDIEELFV
jgi:hypothetical protein